MMPFHHSSTKQGSAVGIDRGRRALYPGRSREVHVTKRVELAVGSLVALGLALAWLLTHAHGGTTPPQQQGEPPDVSVADGAVALGDVLVRVGVAARPIQAFQPVRYRVRAEVGGRPVPLEDARVDFSMSMPMGDHRHALAAAADGWYEATAVLPACASGHRRWYGDVTGTAAGKPLAARFQFDLSPDAPPGLE